MNTQVLQAVHFSVVRDRGCCTLRVLEVILNLVEMLMDMGVLKQCLRDEALGERPVSSAPSEASPSGKPAKTTTETEKPKPITPHQLIMNIIVRY